MLIWLYGGGVVIHTAYDVMKEYLITGAELDGQFQIPMLPKVDFSPGKSIDFVSSKSRSLKGHKDLTVNFYIDDKSFLQVWNQPDQYIEHLKCFNSFGCTIVLNQLGNDLFVHNQIDKRNVF